MLNRDDLSRDLEADLRHGGVHAVYQPLIEVASGRIVGVEGLCRWDRPSGPVIRPDVFIPVAESTGLIHELGRFMLAECLAAGERWAAAGYDLEVSVNVSPIQLTAASFTDDLIATMLARTTLAALTIEITETLPLRELYQIMPRLEELRSADIGISLDDFGAGHTSVAQLRALPLTEVKFDRSLIQDRNPGDRESTLEAAALASTLGLRKVAEGVETQTHLDRAKELGCDRAQGFLFGAPMRVADMDGLLAA